MRTGRDWTPGHPAPIIRPAMHAVTAADCLSTSALTLGTLPVAAAVAVPVSVAIIGIVIIRPSARGALG